jgi:septal ring factor EnvC (AmiA/AmiB activator)
MRAAEALDRLDALTALRAEIATEQGALDSAETELSTQGAQIAALIAARTRELERLRSDSAERAAAAAALASQARTLRELVAALEARAGDYTPETPGGRPDRTPTPRLKPARAHVGANPPPFVPQTGRFADARGSLTPPTTGVIVARYGERSGADAREGMVFRTRAGALVISPFDARVEYAGPFRGYGQLLILSVGDDYHLVLAGVGAIYGEAGQTVLAGEPIGEMAEGPDAARELYVEIRKDGQPIDPGPWWRGGR